MKPHLLLICLFLSASRATLVDEFISNALRSSKCDIVLSGFDSEELRPLHDKADRAFLGSPEAAVSFCVMFVVKGISLGEMEVPPGSASVQAFVFVEAEEMDLLDLSQAPEMLINVMEDTGRGNLIQHTKCPGHPLQLSTNVYNSEKGDFMMSSSLFKCPPALKDKSIQVSIVGLPPFVQYTPEGVRGTEVDIVGIAAKEMGFSFTWKLETTWIECREDGTLGGLVGSVKNESSLLGAGHMIMEYEKSAHVSFLKSAFPLDMRLTSPKPKPVKYYGNFVRPFSGLVWATILVFSVEVALVLWLLISMESRLTSTQRKHWSRTLSAASMEVYKVLLGQASDLYRHSKLHSNKLLQLLWFCAVLFLLSCFECNLRAYIIAVEYEPVLDSHDDILRLNRRLFLPHGHTFVDFYCASQLKANLELCNQVTENEQTYLYEFGYFPEALEREIEKNGDAYLSAKPMMLGAFSETMRRYNGFQPLRLGSETIFYFHTAHVVPKRKVWKKDFNQLYQRLIECGIVQHFIQQYYTLRALNDASYTGHKLEAFTLEHILGGIMVLACGLFLSIAAFLSEKSRKNITRHIV